jgi:hypothetical protein
VLYDAIFEVIQSVCEDHSCRANQFLHHTKNFGWCGGAGLMFCVLWRNQTLGITQKGCALGGKRKTHSRRVTLSANNICPRAKINPRLRYGPPANRRISLVCDNKNSFDFFLAPALFILHTPCGLSINEAASCICRRL